MKKSRKWISLLCALAIAASVAAPQTALAADAAADTASEYVYTINVKVNNPCNTRSMSKDDVNVLYFDYYYNGQNGYKSEEKKTFDMSWNGNSNNNADFLSEQFMRPNDDSYNTSFDVTLPGKLSKIYIKLNMDGGERLSFSIESIYCNGMRINNNTDYVSSAYYDSTATVYCSMDKSVIDEANSPYFQEHEGLEFSEKTVTGLANEVNGGASYAGQFRDQYNAVIDMAVLKNCVESSDGEINQAYSHQDEESMYQYTFYFNVENPINLTNADYNEVETFYIEISYVDQNGYGTAKTYKLDMAYDSGLKRNLNPKYLSYFERNDDNGYKTHFSLWVPGIITQVKCKLNMRGEKLVVKFEKITLGSVAVNADRDYVSSKYYDSDATIPCSVPKSQIAVDQANFPAAYSSDLRDQYGAIVSEQLFNYAKSDMQQFLYHS